jgi:hypothetical protein
VQPDLSQIYICTSSTRAETDSLDPERTMAMCDRVTVCRTGEGVAGSSLTLSGLLGSASIGQIYPRACLSRATDVRSACGEAFKDAPVYIPEH